MIVIVQINDMVWINVVAIRSTCSFQTSVSLLPSSTQAPPTQTAAQRGGGRAVDGGEG